MRYFVLALATSAFAAVAQGQTTMVMMPKPGTVYVSIMGEPFRVTETEGPFDQWFKQADDNQDGKISRLELQNDADYFFKSLDTNNDKAIGFEEMEQYETVVAPPEVRAMGSQLGRYAKAPPRKFGSGRKDEIPIVLDVQAESKSRIVAQKAQPLILKNVPQPVAMADMNFDRRVSFQEFRATASKRFSQYDADHDGRLTRKELEGTQGSR